MNITKKYVLKPGKHQFAPAEAAIHHNDNLTDEAAAWYLKKYPHIKSLFLSVPADNLEEQVKKHKRSKSKTSANGKEEV